MKKMLPLLGALLAWCNFISAQQCNGNACSTVKIFADSSQNQTIKNSSNRQVKVGVKWYMGQCLDMKYYTLAPGEAKSFDIQAICLPYTAEFVVTPANKTSDAAVTISSPGSGSTVSISTVAAKAGPHPPDSLP
jgi:hypothetical protein